MQQRTLGPFTVSAIGLGCMNLTHAYEPRPDADTARAVLREAVDLGYTLFDTATIYGAGENEKLVGRVLRPHRDDIVLTSKCGLFIDEDGRRRIDGRPATLRRHCEDSLRRLGTDVIDLYYLHRMDPEVPIEDSAGALGRLVAEGKIRTIGLSEVSAATLRRAHAEHPVTALQSEYSLWTRNPEIATLEVCRELGVAFVAFSPVARGFLPGTLRDPRALGAKDLRHGMPRFAPENYAANLALLDQVAPIAEATGCSLAQLALAWLLARGEHVIPIPGTTSIEHLRENAAAADIALDADSVARLDGIINERTVRGARYGERAQRTVDTEEFD
ncbi:MAG TPA: aldo/keto reductase [Gammaproteobacteria bacterium]|nr:aldo/keto reductase [Gammaproteobacteria bacterium]